MFDSVRKYQRVMLGLVLLLILPAFVFFGVSGYDQMIGGGDEIAVVDGTKIPRQAFEEAHRQQVERLQQMLGGQVDVKLFDTPAARAQTLEGLITQQAMLAEARAKHIAVPPTEVQKAILGDRGPDRRGRQVRLRALPDAARAAEHDAGDVRGAHRAGPHPAATRQFGAELGHRAEDGGGSHLPAAGVAADGAHPADRSEGLRERHPADRRAAGQVLRGKCSRLPGA